VQRRLRARHAVHPGDEPDNAQPIRDPKTGKNGYGPPAKPASWTSRWASRGWCSLKKRFETCISRPACSRMAAT